MEKKIRFLDGLRGFAAFYVLVFHARWLLWEGYEIGYKSHREIYSVVDKILMIFFTLFRYGHEFVLFFFILSGFVIHLGYAKKFQQDSSSSIDFRNYLYKRFKRIYPPFVLALLLTFLLDTFGKNFNFAIYDGKTPYPLINKNIGNSSLNVSTFFGNLLFLFKEYFPVYGTNGPLWSLKFEWWFYLLYPIFLVFSKKHIWFSSMIMVFLFIASFFPGLWPEPLLASVFSMMICWWLGVLLAEIVVGRINFKTILFSIITFLLFVLLTFFELNNVLEDLRTSFFFSALLSFLVWYNNKGKSLKILEKLKFAGDFSYTLYIIHLPILVFLSGLLMKFNYNQLPHQSYCIIGGILVCLIIAYFFHFVVEVPFLNIRKTGVSKTDAKI